MRDVLTALGLAGTLLSAASSEFVVGNPNDDGAGSLRSAIQSSNVTPGEDVIRFRISGPPPHLIELNSALPIITDPVRIEAEQTSLDQPRLVEISGRRAGADANGLHIAVGNCSVRGLAIGGFGGHGVLIEFFGQHTIQGNFLGADAVGNPRLNGEAGIAIFESNRNRIGGTNSAQGNLISGNGTGVLITGPGSFSNVVEGNLIGPDVSGTVALGNSQNGILIYDAPGNLIGGRQAGSGNLISANGQSGVYLFGPETVSNLISGNLIGLDRTGAQRLGNGFDGVTIYGASRNQVGGASEGSGNVISGNGQRGILISGEVASENIVEGNFIGTDPTGTNELGNGFSGVAIAGVRRNRIGGGTPAARNIISANKQSGILLRGAGTAENVIAGNYIGTDRTGLVSLRNSYNGVTLLEGATENIIGGQAVGAGNVISGNSEAGVFIAEESTGNLLEGNLIGCDATGRHSLSNGYAGVRLEFGGNQIGRPGGRPNIISGNGHAGVETFGVLSSSNRIQGNFVGTDIDGRVALGNAGGIAIAGGTENLIGGLTAGAGNVISGNDDSGIFLVDAETVNNVVQGNWIGTDRGGTNAIPNNGDGISIFDAGSNIIGGTNVLAANIISANLQNGILIRGVTASGNVIQRNLLGTKSDGISALGNRLHGVEIDEGASGNVIGGTPAGPNRIAYSQTAEFDGVRVHSGVGNTIRCNAIFGNRGLAIDIGDDGKEANDPLDPDAGANALQNFPALTQAEGGAGLRVLGKLNSKPGERFTVDFYYSPTNSLAGEEQAGAWIGSIDAITDSAGNSSWEFSVSNAGLEKGYLTATATDASGNSSELSPPVRIAEPDDDADGIPNSFETAHGLNSLSPADAALDPDGDRLTNLQEYLAGTHPFDPASALRLEASMSATGTILGFQTVSERQYRIEYTEEAGTLWRTLTVIAGNGTRANFTDKGGGPRRRFYRLALFL